MASSEKNKAAAKLWAKNNPEKRKEIQDRYRQSDKYVYTYKNAHLKRTYGITLEEYEAMYAAQGCVCAICGKSEFRRNYSGKRKELLPLFVDHCHTTNKVRGLLCSKCNSGLGMFEDSQENLTRAISYLKENNLG